MLPPEQRADAPQLLKEMAQLVSIPIVHRKVRNGSQKRSREPLGKSRPENVSLPAVPTLVVLIIPPPQKRTREMPSTKARRSGVRRKVKETDEGRSVPSTERPSGSVSCRPGW